MKIRNLSLFLLISLSLSFFYFYITPGYLHPAEDAAILFNYAQNFRETGVISYFPGGPRVDGSTDFLFMLLVSLVMHMTSDAYLAAMLVSAFSSVILVLSVFKLLDTKFLSLQYLTLFLIYFSQQIWAAVLGYGTFFYAMTIGLVALAFWKRNLRFLLIASVFAVISRPDALITVLPMIAYRLYTLWDEDREFRFHAVLMYFVLPLMVYGLFRQLYFGKILPLSFDITTENQHKVFGLFLVNSFHHVKSYILYFVYPGILGILLYIIKEKFKIRKEYYVLLFSMVVFPLIAYIMVRENLDFSRRYFIVPYLGIVLTLALFIRNYKSIIASVFLVFLLLKVGHTSINQGVQSLNHYYTNVYDFAEELSEYPELILATSEAGIITWKGRLRTMDLWGLNTAEFTNKLVSPEDIRRWNPDLIFLHAAQVDYVYLQESEMDTQKTWLNMTHRVVHTMYEDDYLTYLFPYDSRLYKEEVSDNVGLFKSFLKFLSESNPKISRRKDLIAIHPESARKAELIQLIEKYGGERLIIRP